MKVGLIGYGQMGQMVDKAATQQGHTIVARQSSQSWDLDALQKADLFIEFTQPESTLDNIRRLAPLKKPIVVGTTGWYDHLEKVQHLVHEHHIGLLYAANFSLGVHLLLAILQNAASIINPFTEYDATGVEYHHAKKKDKPSGTALEIAKTIEQQMHHAAPFAFTSIRCGSIPGTHSVIFDSFCDSITITHAARNREGFAQGALMAAEWLQDKKGLFTFSDCLKDISQRRAL